MRTKYVNLYQSLPSKILLLDFCYDASVLPQESIPVWTKENSGNYHESVKKGKLKVGIGNGGSLDYFVNPPFKSKRGFTIEQRLKIQKAGSSIPNYDGATINAGAPDIGFDFVVANGIIGLVGYSDGWYSMNTEKYHTYTIAVKGDEVSIFVDNRLRISETVTQFGGTEGGFVYFALWSGKPTEVNCDYICVDSISGHYREFNSKRHKIYKKPKYIYKRKKRR